jgi:DNA-binding NtrC family response regulator
VDDEPDILDSVVEVVQRGAPGVAAEGVLSGHEGLAWLSRRSCTLLVVDYRMPGMDGLEFLRRAEALQPEARRILMTAFPDRHLAVRAVQEARVERFLAKPFPAGDLVDLIRLLAPSASAAWPPGRAWNPSS